MNEEQMLSTVRVKQALLEAYQVMTMVDGGADDDKYLEESLFIMDEARLIIERIGRDGRRNG